MISVDTNVILRFLTGQPAAQFASAKALFESGGLFISSPAVFEVFFTLTGSVLGFSDDDAFDALDALFALNGVQVQDRAHFEAALRLARSTPAHALLEQFPGRMPRASSPRGPMEN